MRFVPEKMITAPLCEIAMNRSIYAQQLIPARNLTPALYMYPMKVNGMDLEFVPEMFRTPEVCLQAVMSNPNADEFLPKRTNREYNIYDFYHDFKNEQIIAEYLSFEQIQKAFQGETVHVSGIRFAQNVTLKDFTINYDRNTRQISVKAIDEKPEKKQAEKSEKKPEKRKRMKM